MTSRVESYLEFLSQLAVNDCGTVSDSGFGFYARLRAELLDCKDDIRSVEADLENVYSELRCGGSGDAEALRKMRIACLSSIKCLFRFIALLRGYEREMEESE